MSDGYVKLMARMKDVGRFGAVSQLLDWDQQVYMPPKGAPVRAELSALIAGTAHERLVAAETAKLLDEAQASDGDCVAQTNLRETRRMFERASKVPTPLVQEIARTASLAREAWVKAREKSEFAEFAPYLERMFELKKQVAEHIGYDAEPYDALIDEFEPGARAAEIEQLFGRLQKATRSLLQRLDTSKAKPDPSILKRHYPQPQQEELCRRMSESLGYDFEAGRADVTVHPFCTTIGGPQDVRITTRYAEDSLANALFGTIHETGHALYEQGLLPEHVFTPMGEYVSLGIHESQSRLWENLVGRSREFWEYHWDYLQGLFPESLGGVSLGEFYRAINLVAPSFIRVEADEVTYNLHIVLRFEMERALFTGQLQTRDVPAAWNEKAQQLLGITPPDDRLGCLQDIHWSMGVFGYFPTYALGNLYAAQFFEKAKEDIPNLSDRIAANDHKPLLDWLSTNIHQHGKRYRAGELVEVVTGKPLSIDPFINYVTEKYTEVYGL